MNIRDCTNLYKDNQKRGIILTDKIGVITFCNERWLELCGFTREEVIGKTNKILQGVLTETTLVKEIALDVKSGVDVDTFITNYKKNKNDIS